MCVCVCVSMFLSVYCYYCFFSSDCRSYLFSSLAARVFNKLTRYSLLNKQIPLRVVRPAIIKLCMLCCQCTKTLPGRYTLTTAKIYIISCFLYLTSAISVLMVMILSLFHRLNTKLKVKTANYAQKSFNCLPHSETDLLYSESPAALRCRNSDLSSDPSSVRLPSPHGTVSPRFSEKQTHVTKLCACDQHYTLNIH